MADEPEQSSAKRVHMTMRLAPQLRSQLERAATESGRSLTQEAESRLSQSFETRAAIDQAVKAAFQYTLGGEDAQKVAMMFATAVRIVEAREKAKFGEDNLTTFLAVEVMREIISDVFIDYDARKKELSEKSKGALTKEAKLLAQLVLSLLQKESEAVSRDMEGFFTTQIKSLRERLLG